MVGLISTGLASLSKAHSCAAESNSLVLPFVVQQVVEHQGAETESLSPSHSPPRGQLSKGNWDPPGEGIRPSSCCCWIRVTIFTHYRDDHSYRKSSHDEAKEKVSFTDPVMGLLCWILWCIFLKYHLPPCEDSSRKLTVNELVKIKAKSSARQTQQRLDRCTGEGRPEERWGLGGKPTQISNGKAHKFSFSQLLSPVLQYQTLTTVKPTAWWGQGSSCPAQMRRKLVPLADCSSNLVTDFKGSSSAAT